MTLRNLFLSLFIIIQLFGQNKLGGVVFRVDDNQPVNYWEEFSQIFNKYDAHFNFALNVTYLRADINYIAEIKNLQTSGHEFCDHTPCHATHWFYIYRDPAPFFSKIGVDNIKQYSTYSKINLKYASIDTTVFPETYYLNIESKFLTSTFNGGFKDVKSGVITYLWLPTKQLVLTVGKTLNANSFDSDTIYYSNFWGDTLVLNNEQNVPFKILNRKVIKMQPDALDVLAEETKYFCDQNLIIPPKVFIHPGGIHPLLTRSDISNSYGSDEDYIAGSVENDPSLKCFNEYDPKDDKRFGIEWGDFGDNVSTFKVAKTIITDRLAKHYISINESHFNNLLGGWEAYLSRTDSMLFFLNSNNIPILKYSEAAELLYGNKKMESFENYFPDLNSDIDENGRSDGYDSVSGQILIDSTLKAKVIKISSLGNVFTINNLGGLEKGSNTFSFWASGKSAQFKISLEFPETKQVVSKLITVDADGWVNLKNQLVIPETISFLNIKLDCINLSGSFALLGDFRMVKVNTTRILNDQEEVYCNDKSYCFPNPFNPFVNITFNILKSENIIIKIYDLLGKLIIERKLGELNFGHYNELFDFNNYKSGLYFVEINLGFQKQYHKILLLK